MTFATHPALARALAARGYESATSVQLAVLQEDRVGRDLLVSAQTGSGKTVAFGMAIAAPLLGAEEGFAPAAGPLALVIAPTRELALQVQRELAWLYAEAGARVVTCVGGMDVRAEARQLERGAHIVVGTPGRLRDHLERRRLDLSGLRSIVLDEADEMLDLGFREDLEFILEATPPERQTLMFSATMPREIEALATRYQRDAIRIQTTRRDEQHADIEYQAIRVAGHDIENAVVNVLRFHEARATLVFCSTRDAVKRMHARLVERGFSAVTLSGELSQHERSHALQALRDGRARVLVATDVAARGLDVADLALVIHAELPNNHETLLHRSGRTGRAGKKGLCVLVVPFSRRRKAEALLGAARLKVQWAPAPTAEEIRVRDQERFLADPIFSDPPADEDVALARVLQESRSAYDIALALARIHRASLPAPEDLAADHGPPPRRPDRDGSAHDRFKRNRDEDRPRERSFDKPREGHPRGRELAGGEPKPQPHASRDKAPRAPDSREMVWFRINIGRERNAEPRWLLPLICKAGNVSKAEVGAIKVFDRDTRFQVVADCAEQFLLHVRASDTKEGHITRLGSFEPEGERPRRPRPEAVPRSDEAGAVAAEQAGAGRPAAPAVRHEGLPKWERRGAHGHKPHRKGAGHDTHHKRGPAHGPSHGTSARAAPGEAPRPGSKYAHKKKHRGAPPAKA